LSLILQLRPHFTFAVSKLSDSHELYLNVSTRLKGGEVRPGSGFVDRGELKASEKKPILTTDGQLLGIPPILYLIMFLWTFIVRSTISIVQM
jgi:hypothetical protein